MYHPTTRVLAVLTLLRVYKRMSGAELAARLEVNMRTLRRYITMLQDLGAPIVAERGRNGAYKLESDFKLPALSLTHDETVALTLGLISARQLGLNESRQAMEAVRSKLEEGLSPDLVHAVRGLSETIAPVTDDASADFPTEVMLTMSRAMQLQRRVHLRYRSREASDSERDFDPYGLAQYRGKWYAVGYCWLRHDLRSFRLDRVTALVLTDASFVRPPNFDAQSYVVEAVANLPRQYTYEVLLKTTLTTARQEVMDWFGLLEPQDQGVILRGSADDLDWVARQLAKLSFNFVVREPPALREALRKRAAELVNLADSS
ncbi:MAG: YafY family transcriptional regulator [Anaerolineae bacterium]|nr:YafY family transcriptional regulator [Anaerolineae bacterium]